MNQTKLIYEKTNGLAPFSYVIVDKWLYFCDQCLPALFRYHFETEVCEYVTQFDVNYVNTNFFKLFAYKGELWLLPFLDGKLIRVTIGTWETFYYDIPKVIEETRIPFMDMFFKEEEAYIVPHGDNRFLLKLDLSTYCIQEIELLKKKSVDDAMFFTGAIQFGEQIYMTESSQNQFVIFDINTEKISIKCVEGYSLDNLVPKRVENKIYFFPVVINKREKVLIYDICSNHFAEKEYPIKKLPPEDICIVVVYKKEFWILANKQKKIYKINHNLEIISEIKILKIDEERICASGFSFEDRFFWHGHKGNPLIQVKDNLVQILDVSKDRTFLEAYIEMVNRGSACEKTSMATNIGSMIYHQVISI